MPRKSYPRFTSDGIWLLGGRRGSAQILKRKSGLKIGAPAGHLVEERLPVGRHLSRWPRCRLTFWMRVRRKQPNSAYHRPLLIVEKPVLAGLKAGYDRMPSRIRML